jgi:hypothetical protein
LRAGYVFGTGKASTSRYDHVSTWQAPCVHDIYKDVNEI